MSELVSAGRSLTSGLQIVGGAYRTASRNISWRARRFPSLTFYPQLFANIYRSSTIARRGRYDDQAWVDTSIQILRALEGVGFQFEATGLDQLEKLGGPCLIVANHMSTLESGVLPTLIHPLRPVTFIVKQSLLDYPVFKHVMRALQPIAVTQTNPRLDFKTMLADGFERLTAGTSIIIFPQGARRATFDPSRFNTIGVKIAQRANVPMIPLALSTAGWPLGKWAMDFARLDPSKKARFAFGEPIWVRGRGGEEQAAVIEFIQNHLRRWQAEDQ